MVSQTINPYPRALFVFVAMCFCGSVTQAVCKLALPTKQ